MAHWKCTRLLGQISRVRIHHLPQRSGCTAGSLWQCRNLRVGRETYICTTEAKKGFKNHFIRSLEWVYWPIILSVLWHCPFKYVQNGCIFSRTWSSDMAEAARFPNVYCKLSGLINEIPGKGRHHSGGRWGGSCILHTKKTLTLMPWFWKENEPYI